LQENQWVEIVSTGGLWPLLSSPPSFDDYPVESVSGMEEREGMGVDAPVLPLVSLVTHSYTISIEQVFKNQLEQASNKHRINIEQVLASTTKH